MTSSLHIFFSIVGICSLSLLGGFFVLISPERMKNIILPVVSISTGALLGDVFLHIIPDLAEEHPELFGSTMFIILLGILLSFLLEKIIHWRHCHVLDEHHGHHCHPMGTLSFIGESMHNFIDGVIIAAAYLSSPELGVATTIAIVFHEIPHEIGNMAILLQSGHPPRRALFLNVLAGLAALVGGVLVLLLQSSMDQAVAWLLPFAAGNLLYIAGSDLIPELHKETRLSHAVLQLIGMVAGMGMMAALMLLE